MSSTKKEKNAFSHYMRDFAAIDFETANGYPSSVCSVGVVIVRDGEIVDRYYSLIHPAPNYYNPRNVAVHGLTRKDTDPADCFPDVWADVVQKIEGLPLVAHNKAFDERCLKAAFEHYGMSYPGYEFYCTLTASRRKLGSMLRSHTLPVVALYCGYDMAAHHNALCDAEACACIAIKLL